MEPYYLKTTIRNARKNGTLTFAKLFGLSISFAVILFAAGYVYYETSFDKSIPDHDRIYRCLMNGKVNNTEESFAVTSPAQAGSIASDIPEITEAIRIMYRGESTITYNNESYKWGRYFLADPEFFSFFNIPVKTNQTNPLASNDNLVIGKSLAEKYFGSTEAALGKVVKMGNEDCVITGVFDDPPGNFHLQPKLIMSLQKSNPDNVGWDSQNYYTYFKTVRPVTDIDALNFKISKVVYSHQNSDGRINAAKAKSWDDLRYAPELYVFYIAEPLNAIHFSKHKFDPAITSNKAYVYGAVVLALLILLISSINYINLTIANISTRLKDVGIRKTAGAKNQNIIRQFLFESLVFLLVAFVIAVFVFQLAERSLTQYLNFEISLSGDRMLKITALAFAALLIFNLAAVIVPVIIISNRKILSLIKELKPVKGRFSVNNYSVMLQFVLSGLIILSALLVNKQINYMVNKDRGYDPHNVMMLVMWEMHPETRRSFLEELKTHDAIESVSTADAYFGEEIGMNGAFFEELSDENYFHTTVLPVDDGFQKTFNLQMKEGRFFEKDKKTDFNAAILNETALREYRGQGSMVDKNVFIADKKYTVIGIVKDFNFRSLHHPLQPLVITRIDNFGNVSIRVKNDRIAEAAGILQKLWKKYDISAPLNYTFHDQVVAEHYLKDQQAKRLLLVLSVISIIIACVGLYAISFFRIVKRTKEIGIRKVNGACASEVVYMLNKDFLKWVAFAFVIACPIAWYAMHKWLQNFAYKTTLSWWVFAAAGVIALLIALLTVSWQSWTAARRNPVEALRYE
jgi:putative ABC transport system permease protein